MGVFTRDESELLKYDGNAFWYFAGTMLTFIVLPWTWLLFRSLMYPKPSAEEDFDRRGPGVDSSAAVRRCTTSHMQAKRDFVAGYARSWRYRLGGGVKLQLVVLCALWVALVATFWRLRDSPAQLQSFDPYAILGLSKDSEMGDIKKAYRTKSLQHHPDKDRDNPLAPVMFQQVAKAYAALTDEGARRNYAKYGNPDGPQQMKVGIALHPDILVSKERQRLTLCIFFFVLFFVPSCILCCCLRGSRLSYGGVSADTLRMLHACIDEEVEREDGPGLLAASAECMRAMSSDIQPLAQAMLKLLPQPLDGGSIVEVLNGPVKNGGAQPVARGVVRSCGKKMAEVEVRDVKPGETGESGEVREVPIERLNPMEPRAPCPFSDLPVRRNNLLIWGHLWRLHGYMQPAVLSELQSVLRHSVAIVRAMIGIAGSPPHDSATFFNIVRNLIDFRVCLIQALDFDTSALLQMPHINSEKLRSLKDVPTLKQIVSGSANTFLDRLNFSAEQRLDIDAFCRHVPAVELSCSVEVNDEEGIAHGDVATLTVTLTRTNLAEGESAGPVHAPCFPIPKFEEWWILVYDDRDRRLVTVDVINGCGREETTKIHFMVPRAGDFRWTVWAMCDSYKDLNTTFALNFSALKRNQVSHEVFVHPEDVNIKTLFEELMEGLNPEPEEEESESEDELPLRSAASATKAGQSSQASAVGAVEVVPAAVAEEPKEKPRQNDQEDCDDSDCEEGDHHQEPEGSFFEITGQMAYLSRAPSEEPELRVGSIPRGTVIRAFDSSASSCPPGWAEVAWAPGAFIQVGETAEAGEAEEIGVKHLPTFLELPLRTVVQTRLPLILLKRWCKRATAEITVDDLSQVIDIEETMIRMTIEGLIRRRVGDSKYESLLDQTEAKAAKAKERILKARGHFASQNGIVWHVTPSGLVKGLHPDGSKIRDRVQVSAKDDIRIGPFILDETRTCSCIHWTHEEDSDRAWVWARDRTVDTKVRMGSW